MEPVNHQEKSTASQDQINLTDDFPAHTYEEWKEAAIKLLKGAPFEKRLITRTYEGFDIQPIYTRSDLTDIPHLKDMPGLGNRVRGNKASGYLVGSWGISQEGTAVTPEEFNDIAARGLERGESELNIIPDQPTMASTDADQSQQGLVGKGGLSLSTLSDLETMFNSIQLEWISTYFQCGSHGLGIAALLFAYLRKKKSDHEGIKGCIEIDPLTRLVETGTLPKSWDSSMAEMAILTKYVAENAPCLQTIGVKSIPYHNGGGSISQEIGLALASGTQYVREMLDRGLSIDKVVPRFRFTYAVGSNFFMEIAKLRAARLLWAKVTDSFGATEDARSAHIHARTSEWNKTLFDPYNNLLRTTTEAFSAVVGGCDSMHVGPFDEIMRQPDDFSRRLARNIHIMLAEECDMQPIIDPAGGSYYIETLTDQIAAQAWKVFQEIEAAGGILPALEKEIPQKMVAETARDKARNIEKRKDIFVGTNMYPNTSEKLLEKREPDYAAVFESRSRQVSQARQAADQEKIQSILSRMPDTAEAGQVMDILIQAAEQGATSAQIQQALLADAQGSSPKIQPILLRRGAEDYEKLRKAAGRYEAQNGQRPMIFQANIGPSRKYRARADWTSAFFQAGGFFMKNDTDFESVDDAIAAADESKATFVIIVSDDKTYPDVVPHLARTLKANQPERVIMVAGAPGETETEWREAGVEDFISVKVNNYQKNKELLTRVGALP